MAEFKFKHLDLMEEKGIEEKELFKTKEIKQKMQGFNLWKGKYERDGEENSGLRAEKLSDELCDVIMRWSEHQATTKPAKPAKPALSEEEIIAKAAERLKAQQDAEVAKAADNAKKQAELAEAKRIADEAEVAKKKTDAEAAELARQADEAKKKGEADEATRLLAEKAELEKKAKEEADRLAAEEAARIEEANRPDAFKTLFGGL